MRRKQACHVGKVFEQTLRQFDDVREAIDTAFQKLQDPIRETGTDAGCTAVVALLMSDTLWVANAGDSRAVLSRGRVAERLSLDHNGKLSEERQRIQELGGFVTEKG